MPYSVVFDPADFLEIDTTGNTEFPFNAGITSVFSGENEDESLLPYVILATASRCGDRVRTSRLWRPNLFRDL